MEYKKVIAFDMDDVICDNRTDKDRIAKYLKRKPIQKNIDIINDLYEEGYKILIYTARGMLSFRGDINEINEILRPITENQLKEWGVKYHELHMGKIFYDLLIDDKAINSYTVKNKNNIIDFFDEEIK